MVAHIAAYDGKDLVLVLKHEQIERALVTFLHARYQLLVCVLRRLRCHSKTPKHSDRDIEAHRHASLLNVDRRPRLPPPNTSCPAQAVRFDRSEERRVGKRCRTR